MSKIYIGFSCPKHFSIGSYSIKTWIREQYSHVYLRFESTNQEIPTTVYHAANGMVHFKPFLKFKEDNSVIKEYCVTLPEEHRIKTLSDCMWLSGEKYGYKELITILFYDIAYYFGKKLETYDGAGYICSELVATLLINRLGLKFGKPAYLLKPNCVDKKLQEEYLKNGLIYGTT